MWLDFEQSAASDKQTKISSTTQKLQQQPARPQQHQQQEAGDSFFLIGRISGTIEKYTIPHIALESRYLLRCRPQLISINCNASKLSIIDINGVLTFYDTTAKGSGMVKGEHLDSERKDVWDMK